jgi:hypothetical protein
MRGRPVLLASFVVGLLSAIACSNADDKLNERVKAKVAEEPGANPVAVMTQDRIVTLGGVVDNQAERNRIETSVRRVDGVLGVKNQLVVKQEVQTTGAEIESGRDGGAANESTKRFDDHPPKRTLPLNGPIMP